MEKQRVLVVDDDREIVNAIAINLLDEGYEALKAYDGLQALDLVSTQSVHLFLKRTYLYSPQTGRRTILLMIIAEHMWL